MACCLSFELADEVVGRSRLCFTQRWAHARAPQSLAIPQQYLRGKDRICAETASLYTGNICTKRQLPPCANTSGRFQNTDNLSAQGISTPVTEKKYNKRKQLSTFFSSPQRTVSKHRSTVSSEYVHQHSTAEFADNKFILQQDCKTHTCWFFFR